MGMERNLQWSWMLFSLAELWADLQLHRELTGLWNLFAPSPRVGPLSAREVGWQERSPLGVGSK